MAIPQRLQAGQRLADDDALNIALATPQWQTNTNITALAGGSRTGAPVLVLGSNEVTTVASSGDSVVLPKAVPGSVVFLANAGSASLQLFADGSDTINGTAGATGITLVNGKRILCVAADLAQWYTILTA